MADKIRLGVIGCGGMGKSHQRNSPQLQDRLDWTAVADIVPERAQQAAEITGARLAVTDPPCFGDELQEEQVRALDAADGRTVRTYEGTEGTSEILQNIIGNAIKFRGDEPPAQYHPATRPSP